MFKRLFDDCAVWNGWLHGVVQLRTKLPREGGAVGTGGALVRAGAGGTGGIRRRSRLYASNTTLAPMDGL